MRTFTLTYDDEGRVIFTEPFSIIVMVVGFEDFIGALALSDGLCSGGKGNRRRFSKAGTDHPVINFRKIFTSM